MKKLNYMLLTLLSVFAFTWTACDDSAEWTTPELSSEGRGVYFNKSLPSKIELSKEATTFDVQVMRSYSDIAETIALNVEEASGKFTIPASVVFKEGETTSTLTIGYNPDEMEYDEFFDIKLTIADASKHFTYGYPTYSFSAGVPAPWVSLGLGTYTDDLLLSLFGENPVTYQVEVEQNMLNENLLRIVNPYGANFTEASPYPGSETTHYIELNVTDPEGVYFTYCDTGVDWGYGSMGVWSMADYYMTEGGYTLDVVKANGMCGTFKDGIITFPVQQLIVTDNDGMYYGNQNGKFLLALPGVEIGDYSVTVTYKGRFTDASDINSAVADITLGEDVETAKVAMINGDDINAAFNGIVDGTIPSIEIEKSQEVSFELPGSGAYTIVAVSYAGGEARETGYASLEFVAGGSKWKSLGKGIIYDGIISPFLTQDPVSWEVEIEESNLTPGLYRLVNPFGEGYPLNSAGTYDTSEDHYIEINASDPTGVYLPLTNSGFDIGTTEYGSGNIYIYSYAAYYLDNNNPLEAIKEAGYCGTLTDGVISFPSGSIMIGWLEANNDIYGGCDLQVALPGAAAANYVSAKAANGSHRSAKPANLKKFTPDKEMYYKMYTSKNRIR